MTRKSDLSRQVRSLSRVIQYMHWFHSNQKFWWIQNSRLNRQSVFPGRFDCVSHTGRPGLVGWMALDFTRRQALWTHKPPSLIWYCVGIMLSVESILPFSVWSLVGRIIEGRFWRWLRHTWDLRAHLPYELFHALSQGLEYVPYLSSVKQAWVTAPLIGCCISLLPPHSAGRHTLLGQINLYLARGSTSLCITKMHTCWL